MGSQEGGAAPPIDLESLGASGFLDFDDVRARAVEAEHPWWTLSQLGDGDAIQLDIRAAPSARGVFNLWSWHGLKSDGTLRDAMSGSAHWIWNEGVPADIPTFEGTRFVLLGPPPYVRWWNSGRRFPALPGELSVETILTPTEVREVLARLAMASAAAETRGSS